MIRSRSLPRVAPVARPALPQPNPGATLQGSVVLPSGEPAVHAYVMAVERGGHTWSVPIIDASGSFVNLHYCGVGCTLTASAAPDLVAGPVVVRDASVPLVLRLARAPAVLSGTITDGHAPFSTLAAVRLVDPRGAMFFGFAGDAGAYSVGFSPGYFRLHASADDRLVQEEEKELAGSTSLDWVLPPAGAVTVKPAGKGYAFSPALDETTWRSSRSLETGERAISNLPVGPRTLWIFDDLSVGHADVEVRAGETTAVSAPLSPGATLSGRVVGADGTPLEGALVQVRGPVPRGARTDHDGFYRLDGLAPVHTEVGASADGFTPTRQEVDPVATEMSTLAFTMNRAAR